ncbi:MAG: arylsulfatase [Verrucomicrobiota bacterium]
MERTFTVLFGFLFLSVSSVFAAERPNIIILYGDDLGYGDLGCYNEDSKIPTPHLDQLAAEGMRFTDGHSSSGICTPSRYALLTGRYHWRKMHGIVNAFGGSVFDPEILTLPEMLKEKGYYAALIGKWHLGWDWDAIKKSAAEPHEIMRNNRKTKVWGPEDFDWSKRIPDGPLEHGFDYCFTDTVINFPPYCWIENDRVTAEPTVLMDTGKFKPIKEGNWEFRPGPMVEGWDPYENIPTTTAKGVELIKERAAREEPFFLFFAFPSPHAPIIPNDEFDGASEAGPYGDFVVETDAAIGKLLKALEDSGEADNTLVIFTADNGPEQYAYPRLEKFQHWSSYPLRGLKRDIYEGGHRVPYIVKWPGKIAPGEKSDALVSQIDVMASIATVVDYELPSEAAEDSYDLSGLWTGKTAVSARQEHVHNTRAGGYAIRRGDWVLVDAKSGYVSRKNEEWESTMGYTAAAQGAEGQLYDLSEDLEQRRNLIDKKPEKAAALRKLLARVRAGDGQ